ncbi:TetR/AcrR family transcriptional regulator [Kitasatospora sp. NBC_00315]|uniref:TetR/AcrR family transcriptional regulator n=1 Tax=Kitasatospora sp. NBC_00315 TaxID=2975963 RepID=UPI00324FDA16
MSRTVDWSALRASGGEAPEAEGLRERKKRATRQQLTDTATEMFLDRGFDAVTVAEIAATCGVSEKTVFNYFPTKESLLLDLPESVTAALRSGLAAPGATPVEAVLGILAGELEAVVAWLRAQEDQIRAAAMFRRFGALLRSTPSLRAHQREMTERLIAVAAEVLSRRAELGPADPEPQIAATALLGLWPIQFRALGTYLDGSRTPGQLQEAVTADVRRAARLLDSGLAGFPPSGGAADRR